MKSYWWVVYLDYSVSSGLSFSSLEIFLKFYWDWPSTKTRARQLTFQLRKRLYNYKCPFVRLSVCQSPNPPNSLKSIIPPHNITQDGIEIENLIICTSWNVNMLLVCLWIYRGSFTLCAQCTPKHNYHRPDTSVTYVKNLANKNKKTVKRSRI